MRVLIVSTTGAGHVNPLVTIALALGNEGHVVEWATGEEEHAGIEHLGIKFHGIGLPSSERGRRANNLIPPEVLALPPRARRPFVFSTIFGRVAAPAAAQDLAPLIDRNPPDLIVHESAEFASPAVATARGIPHATVGFGNALPAGQLAAVAEAVAPLWSDAGLDVPPDAGLYANCYLHPWPARLAALPPVATAMAIRPVFPRSQPMPSPNGETTRPFVCITFTEEHAALAPWRAILEALASQEVDIVCAIHPTTDANVLGPLPENARLEWSALNLEHLSRASLLISNPPSELLLKASSLGIPQLALPVTADQFDNADAVSDAGIGITIEASDATADRVHDATAHLLHEPTFRHAAQAVAEEISAMPTPTDRVPDLEALAAGRLGLC